MSRRAYEQLEVVESEWKEIYGESKRRSPFLSYEFIKLWYECFAGPEDIRIYLARKGNRTIGFLPLIVQKAGPIRILKSITNDHCFHSDPLFNRSYENIFAETLLKEILEDDGSWDIFKFSFSYSFSQLPGLFSDELLNNMDVVWERREQPTYAISLNKSYEEYFRKDLSLNTQKNFMRYLNRLKKAGDYRVVECRGTEGLNRWDDFVELEDSGWKGEEHSSIKSISQSYQKYYMSFVELLANQDDLDMYFLELNGMPIAGVFGYSDGEIYHWWKTGYDEKYKDLSPSNLLILFIIKHIMKHYPKIKMFHMFPSDYNYKHRYTNMTATCFETIIFSPSKRGRLVYAFDKLKGNVRKIIKPQIKS